MVDRFLVWLSAGIVATGLSAATLAGAGVAIATEGAAGDAGGTTSSESTNSADSETDSDTETAGTPTNDAEDATTEGQDSSGTGDEEATEEEAAEEAATEEEAPEEEAAEEEAAEAEADAAHDSDTAASERDEEADPKQDSTLDRSAPAQTEADESNATENDDVVAVSTEPEPTVVRAAVVVDTTAAEVDDTPEVAAVAFASAAPVALNAAAASPPFAGVLDLIGTIVFNLYGFVLRTVGGPPVLPPNSTVTVRSSTLVLECGCNVGDEVEVPADWYIPAGAEEDPPERLIYLQHGFLAQGPWYSHTAAALAEETNSIVVAPSIWSNFLASDGCWLGAPPMHEAIAGLFAENNTALADSALAAGYSGPIPDRVVLIGHSLGGGAVAGTSGNMVKNGSIDRLAGVIMLDGVPLDELAAENLGLVPDEIPIYQLAAPKYFWNQFGIGTEALLAARPNQFIGVTLVGGSHVDSMRGGNPLIQFSQQLVSGFSKPENVDAARILMIGWTEDMFAENQDEGIYLDPDEQYVLDTPAGEATLVALPNDLEKPFILNFMQAFVSAGTGIFTLEPSCVAESLGTTAVSCQGSTAA
jgi:hypothetical protein